MPQQHNPGRHVQSLTLPQSRHNHRNTSAYIFPTVPTPRTTPPAPGPNAPTQFASAIQDTSPPPHAAPLRPDSSDHLTSADPQCSTSPPRLTRAIQDTPLPPNTDPTSSRHLGPPPTPGHASPPGSNAPTPRRNAPASFKAHPCRRTTVPPSRRLGQSRRHRNPPRAGHCLTSPPGPNAPTFRRNSPAPFKTLPHRRTTAPTPSRRLEPPRRHRDPPRAGHKKIRLCEPDLFICQ